MAPRKRKATADGSAEGAPSDTSTPTTASKSQQIDWKTIDHPKQFGGFTLGPAKVKQSKKSGQAKKKQKTSEGETEGYRNAPLDADIVQKNPFSEGDLSQTHYSVKPAAHWESTQRYRKFTISEAEFEVGQSIFVEKTPEKQDSNKAIQHWLGRVLEVRAGDASHVYLRVYWLYRPEDLPSGRLPHHGESELIASNHMDIIEALSVVDRANVIHWDEDPEKPWPPKEQLFWRQTYDVEKPLAKRLSPLRPICVDKAPCNPDESVVQCPSCSEWLHAHCLEDQAVQDAINEHMPENKGSAAKGKKKGARKSSPGEAFTAHLSTIGENGPTHLTVTDKRPRQKNKQWNVDVNCLFCKELIEKASEEVPPDVKTEKTTVPRFIETTALPSQEVVAKEEENDSVTDKDSKMTDAFDSPPIEPPQEPVPNVRGRGRPRKPKTITATTAPTSIEAPMPTAAATAITTTVAKTARSEETITPPPALVSESVIQSGLRSVKKLFWGKT